MRKKIKFICMVISVIAILFAQLKVQAKSTKADSAFKENFYIANMSNINTFSSNQHEQKKIFGWLLRQVINWVASWFAPAGGYGKWDEGGHNSEGPYFIFDKHSDLSTQISNLRTKIQSDANFNSIYRTIYELACMSSN